METLTENIRIGNAYSSAAMFSPRHSYVPIFINNKTIILASKHYTRCEKTRLFYKTHEIGENINLIDIPHGGDKDTPKHTLPLFLKSAHKLYNALSIHDKILVNCNHGRSRTGSVVALFLMNYYGLNADEAIDIVTDALKKRGFANGIDIINIVNGCYGDWIREYERGNLLEGNKENVLVPEVLQPIKKSRWLEEHPGSFFHTEKKYKITELETNSLSKES